jgi:uncharacterized protein
MLRRSKAALSRNSSTERERAMTEDEKKRQAQRFLSLLGNPNEDVLRSVAVEDVTWTFPGTSPISGEAHGIADVMERPTTIAAHGVCVEVIGAVHGLSGVAMILHNTALRNDRVLDEQVAAVFSFRGDKVNRLDTFLSDVAMAEAFFA